MATASVTIKTDRPVHHLVKIKTASPVQTCPRLTGIQTQFMGFTRMNRLAIAPPGHTIAPDRAGLLRQCCNIFFMGYTGTKIPRAGKSGIVKSFLCQSQIAKQGLEHMLPGLMEKGERTSNTLRFEKARTASGTIRSAA